MPAVYASMVHKDTAVDITTGVLVKITLDGGTQTTGLGALEHEGEGQWSYVPTPLEENGTSLGVLFHGNDSIPQNITVQL